MKSFTYRPRTAEVLDRRATQQGGEFQSFIRDEYRTYSAKKGENIFRILPPTWDDTDAYGDHYGIDIYVHYSVGPDNATVLCPFKMKDEPCPLCEERVRLERKHDEESKEFKPTRRVLVWGRDKKDEARGVVAWAMPYTCDRDIAKITKDKSTGERYQIDNPEEGYDVYFDREGESMTTKYTGWQLARRPTRVSTEDIEYIMENPLPNVLLWRDYDEIKRLYEGASERAHVQENKPITSGRVALPVQRTAVVEEETTAEDEPPFETEEVHTPVQEVLPPPDQSPVSRAAALKARLASR